MKKRETSILSKSDLLDEGSNNPSSNAHFSEILQVRLSRRQIMKGGLGAAALGMFGSTLVGCNSDSSSTISSGNNFSEPVLGFKAVSTERRDTITVPEGYSAIPFLALGTPVCGSYPAYKADGSNSGADQEQQMGMCHDGIHYFPINDSSDHGLLVMNHEYVIQNVLHANGATMVDDIRTVEDEVRKEVAAHGVSIVEIKKDALGAWEVVPGNYNRRITGATPMALRGPVRGNAKVRTKYSPAGTMTRGTLNNCGNGYTPWNTYLTCEENWAGYFVNKDAELPREHSRYGVRTINGRYSWETVNDDDYERFNVSSTGASSSDDYRNEVNTFGWIVEIDPFNPDSTPIKRTAMGRFAHEGAIFAPAIEGQPIVYYSGDDARNEYIYKYVSLDNYYQSTANGELLDNGTLYVAKFDANGNGEWLALDYDDAAFQAACVAADVQFADQADVLLNTRLAADTVGATRMDRPEWGAVHPHTGEVYFTLTNNTSRTEENVDEANPRANNTYGHIIRWRESGNASASSFEWDIFVLSGTPEDSGLFGDSTQPLNTDSMHACPDGLWIDPNGVLWIQTDMSGSLQAEGPFGANQMLAAEPATGEIIRFMTGPNEQETTGVVMTPDMRTMFVNIQHPGDRSPAGGPFTSNWPDGGSNRPRCATVIVSRDDGGVIGL